MRSSIAEDVLRSSAADGVRTLTLNRPERRTAIDPQPRAALGGEDRDAEAASLARTALRATEDHREGLAAARERREPDFKGS